MEIADRPLYLNADKTKVVEEGDAEARFVLAGEGGTIPPEYRDLPGLKKAAKKDETDAKAVTAAPENKAVVAKSSKDAK